MTRKQFFFRFNPGMILAAPCWNYCDPCWIATKMTKCSTWVTSDCCSLCCCSAPCCCCDAQAIPRHPAACRMILLCYCCWSTRIGPSSECWLSRARRRWRTGGTRPGSGRERTASSEERVWASWSADPIGWWMSWRTDRLRSYKDRQCGLDDGDAHPDPSTLHSAPPTAKEKKKKTGWRLYSAMDDGWEPISGFPARAGHPSKGEDFTRVGDGGACRLWKRLLMEPWCWSARPWCCWRLLGSTNESYEAMLWRSDTESAVGWWGCRWWVDGGGGGGWWWCVTRITCPKWRSTMDDVLIRPPTLLLPLLLLLVSTGVDRCAGSKVIDLLFLLLLCSPPSALAILEVRGGFWRTWPLLFGWTRTSER